MFSQEIRSPMVPSVVLPPLLRAANEALQLSTARSAKVGLELGAWF